MHEITQKEQGSKALGSVGQLGMNKVLFIDFDGTICFDRFWQDRPRVEYEQIQSFLFQGNPLAHEWMRGKVQAEEVCEQIGDALGFDAHELFAELSAKCRTMYVPQELRARVGELRSSFSTVLITTNMDTMTRFTWPSLGLDEVFDRLENSADSGRYKTDDNGQLFVDVCAELGADISRSVLVDDSESACSVFRERGGTAYQVSKERSTEVILEKVRD